MWVCACNNARVYVHLCVCVCGCLKFHVMDLPNIEQLASVIAVTCLSISCLAIHLELMHLILTFFWLWYDFTKSQIESNRPNSTESTSWTFLGGAHLVVGPEWLDTCTGHSMWMPSRSKPIKIIHNLSTTQLEAIFFATQAVLCRTGRMPRTAPSQYQNVSD